MGDGDGSVAGIFAGRGEFIEAFAGASAKMGRNFQIWFLQFRKLETCATPQTAQTAATVYGRLPSAGSSRRDRKSDRSLCTIPRPVFQLPAQPCSNVSCSFDTPA